MTHEYLLIDLAAVGIPVPVVPFTGLAGKLRFHIADTDELLPAAFTNDPTIIGCFVIPGEGNAAPTFDAVKADFMDGHIHSLSP